jgi:hypothetical protein
MDVDALVTTLGKDGCLAVGLAGVVLLAVVALGLIQLAYNVAEMRHRERLEAVRRDDPERATREAAERQAAATRREERSKLLHELREQGLDWGDAEEWLRVHGLD